MESVPLSSGVIDYEDSGGEGPVIVLVGGVMMDATLWADVVRRLTPTHRCIVPVLPLGGHRRPMNADADRSVSGIAELLAEFVDALDLHDITLVASDWGGPQITATRHPDKISGLVLLPEEAFDNAPPGLPGTFAALAGRLPGGIFPVAQSLRVPLLWRLPMTFGRMTKRPIPKQVRTSWIVGIRTQRGVRRDLAAYVRTSDFGELEQASLALARFARPTLILWASQDRVMPPEHGRRLAAMIPDATLVEIDDACTLLPLDRPEDVATHIEAFVSRLFTSS